MWGRLIKIQTEGLDCDPRTWFYVYFQLDGFDLELNIIQNCFDLIADVYNKISRQTAVLKRMKKILRFHTKKLLWLTVILLHLNYRSETRIFDAKLPKICKKKRECPPFCLKWKANSLYSTARQNRPVITWKSTSCWHDNLQCLPRHW